MTKETRCLVGYLRRSGYNLESESRRRKTGREGFYGNLRYIIRVLAFSSLLPPLPSPAPEMGGAEGPSTTATTSDAVVISSDDSGPTSPPDISPVGSPDHDVQRPPSDEDHDLDHEDHSKDGLSPHEVVLTDDLKHQIIKQAIFSLFNDSKYDLNLFLKMSSFCFV